MASSWNVGRRELLRAGLVAGVAAVAGRATAQPARPNIVLVLTDDQGYGDLACHGNPVLRTPNLDRLHAESVRFTDFQVSPTCAPTRCALLTGRHEFHSGVTHTILERERMALGAVTIADVLRQAGYATGLFGKWHLGDEPAYQPDQRGFDEVFIHGGGGIGQTYPGSCGDAPGNTYHDPAILHNGRFERTQGYCTSVFVDQALRWIDSRRRRGPFYCHLATNVPHAPLQCPAGYRERYAGRGLTANQEAYCGMVEHLDEQIGRLLAKLREWDLERDTLLVFMTDNGGTAGVPIHNAGMRGAKGSAWQGGTRVPSFWRWPAGFRGGVDVPALAAHLDYFPTLAEVAGAAVPEPVAARLEGRSLVPLLRDPAAPWADRTLFTHLGRWERGRAAQSQTSVCAVRTARWRLVNPAKDGERWELHDVLADPGEQTDVLAQHPEVVGRLRAAQDAWWAGVLPDLVNEEATGPAVNPFKERYWQQFGGGPDGQPGQPRGDR